MAPYVYCAHMVTPTGLKIKLHIARIKWQMNDNTHAALHHLIFSGNDATSLKTSCELYKSAFLISSHLILSYPIASRLVSSRLTVPHLSSPHLISDEGSRGRSPPPRSIYRRAQRVWESFGGWSPMRQHFWEQSYGFASYKVCLHALCLAIETYVMTVSVPPITGIYNCYSARR
jgi:hypothetical protein